MDDSTTERMAILMPMRVPASFIAAVDGWRRQQPDIPSRAEAVRRLVVLGIDADTTIEQRARSGR